MRTERNGSKVTLYAEGRIDANCAQQFAAEMERAVAGATELVLDFNGMTYISSSGLRAVMLAVKTMGRQGEMRIIGVNALVYEILEITGFTGMCEVERSEQ